MRLFCLVAVFVQHAVQLVGYGVDEVHGNYWSAKTKAEGSKVKHELRHLDG